jgi:cell division protein FtsZ
VIDTRLQEEVLVTVIATGFEPRAKAMDAPTKVVLDSFTNDDLDIPAFLRRK